MAKKNLTYEEAVNEIESILEKIEQEDLNVEDLGKNVRRVSELIKMCKARLKATEQEVDNIIKEMDGQDQEPLPFDDDTQDDPDIF
jgi:exodeoxyribonuclease VII small subunit